MLPEQQSVESMLPNGAGASRLILDVQNLLASNRPAALHAIKEISRLIAASSVHHPETVIRGGLASWQVRRVKDFVAEHLGGPLPHGLLAAQVRLSSGHFATAFKRSFGCTPHVYVQQRRLELAKVMMLTSARSLCEIAIACGLFDQAHFSRTFRRVVGTSPLAWRRENQGVPTSEIAGKQAPAAN